METIGINTMTNKSERATRIFILPKVWLLSCDSTDLVKRPSTRARSPGGLRDELVEAGERGVRRRFIFFRQVGAIDPSRAKAEGSRAHDVPAVRRNENGLARRDLEALGHERVSLGTRFVEADRVDRENGIEVAADVGCLDGGRPIPADGGMHVEKRAIGIEDESAWHGQAS